MLRQFESPSLLSGVAVTQPCPGPAEGSVTGLSCPLRVWGGGWQGWQAPGLSAEISAHSSFCCRVSCPSPHSGISILCNRCLRPYGPVYSPLPLSPLCQLCQQCLAPRGAQHRGPMNVPFEQMSALLAQEQMGWPFPTAGLSAGVRLSVSSSELCSWPACPLCSTKGSTGQI